MARLESRTAKLLRAVRHNAHNQVAAENPGSRRIVDTMHEAYYSRHMVSSVYWWVEPCVSSRRHREIYKHNRHLQHFPARGPLGFVAVDILGALPKT